MEAENLATSEAADRFTFVGTPERVGCIEHELQVPAAGNGFQTIDVARPTPSVNADDTASPWRDHSLDLRRIKIVGSRVDVAEYRCDLLPLERVCRGDESERRHDDLAGEIERPDGDLQSNRGIAHGNAVTDADECGKFGLELLDIGTIVSEPNTVEHLIDTRQEMLAIADIRPADVDFLGKCRGFAENRQI